MNTARLTAFPATLRAKSCGDAMCDSSAYRNHRSSEDQEIQVLFLLTQQAFQTYRPVRSAISAEGCHVAGQQRMSVRRGVPRQVVGREVHRRLRATWWDWLPRISELDRPMVLDGAQADAISLPRDLALGMRRAITSNASPGSGQSGCRREARSRLIVLAPTATEQDVVNALRGGRVRVLYAGFCYRQVASLRRRRSE